MFRLNTANINILSHLSISPPSVNQKEKTEFINIIRKDSLLDNDHTKCLLIKNLVHSSMPRNKRARDRITNIKILYGLYQLNKNKKSGKWKEVAPGKSRIGKTAKVSRKAVTRFINGDGLVFFKKTSRFKTTNIYEMEKWVVEFFEFFERKGMMKGFMNDFDVWKKKFLKRLDKWLLPLLEKKFTLHQILMNKLSTKKELKGAYPPPLKGAGIKPTGSMNPIGIKTKDENADLGLQQSNEVAGILSSRLFLSGADIRQFLARNGASIVKKAAEILCYRIEVLKWKPRSTVKALQKIINDLKMAA